MLSLFFYLKVVLLNFLFIFVLIITKTNKQMNTQADDLRLEIKTLEVQLQHAGLFQDAFSQIRLYKELEEKKSLLDTLQWM